MVVIVITIVFTILMKEWYEVPSTRSRFRSYNGATNVFRIIINPFIFFRFQSSPAMLSDFQRISRILVKPGKNLLIAFTFQYHHYVHFRLSVIKVPRSILSYLLHVVYTVGAAVAQAVQCLITGWTIGVRSPARAKDFSCSPCVQTGSGAHPARYPMGTERGKARPGRDADHSPSSSDEVKYE
jgi:hypothetical protein